MRRLRILVATALLLAVSGCGEERTPMRHAVVILVDTLRADALDQAHTPNIDALAARGAQVGRAWSSGTWTAPSLVSLFTGMHVREHGWNFGFRGSRSERHLMYPPLPPTPTLPEVLKQADFSTAGIFASHVLRWRLGFDRGFDRWTRAHDGEIPHRVWEEVAGWNDGRRHFLYVHLMGPHRPLRPTAVSARRWNLTRVMAENRMGLDPRWVRAHAEEERESAIQVYRRAYWAVVEDTDRRVGDIVEALSAYLDQTLVVLTSDHGELLGEHGSFGHGGGVFEPLTRVPLVAAGAGPLPATLTLAALPDLVTRALGLDHDWPVSSVEDALPLVSQREEHFALSADGRYKAYWRSADDLLGVYDIEESSLERETVEGRDAELAAERRAFESAVPRGEIEADPIEADREMIEGLRELGYLEE